MALVDVELERFSTIPRPSWQPPEIPGRRSSREGVWECPKLPFFVNELSADVAIEDGILSIKHAARGQRADDPAAAGTIGCATRLARAGPPIRRDRPRARSATEGSDADRNMTSSGMCSNPRDGSTRQCASLAGRPANRLI